jgi:fucose permease
MQAAILTLPACTSILESESSSAWQDSLYPQSEFVAQKAPLHRGTSALCPNWEAHRPSEICGGLRLIRRNDENENENEDDWEAQRAGTLAESGYYPRVFKGPRVILWSLITCNLGMMVLAIAINLLPVFLTTIAIDLGKGRPLSAEQLGRIGAVTFIGLVAGILVTGPLADRWGARIFAVGGNALIALGLVAFRWTADYPMLLGAAFVGGVGAGILDMVLSPIVSSLMRGQSQTAALNVLHSFYCTGAIMTILAGSLSLRFNLSWRTLALGLSPMPLVVGIALCFLPIPSLIEAGQVRIRARQLVRQRFFLLTMVTIFLGGATELGMAYWLPAYAEKSLGYAPWTAALAFLGFSLAMTVGRLGMMFLPKTVGAIPLMLVCCVATAMLFPIASFAPNRGLAVTACILVGLTGSCLWPTTLAVAADRYPQGGATMFALLGALGNFGGIFMPWQVGVLADHWGLRWGLSGATFCPLLMILTLQWMRRLPVRSELIEPVGLGSTPL